MRRFRTLPALSRALVPPALWLGVLVGLAACAGRPSPEANVRLETALRDIGKLRTEEAPADAPFSNDDLVENFRRIALHHEVDIARSGSEANAGRNPLARWHRPIRWSVVGRGSSDVDYADIVLLMARVARLTGLDIREADPGETNMLILLVAEEERDSLGRALARRAPALAGAYERWRSTPSILCAATVPRGGRRGIGFAMVVVGSEVTGLLRRSCLHEEIVQALGLMNDHPGVRPSIFNDDEEFALMTAHDEWLLRLLYDPALSPGMSEAEAMPIVRRLVARLRPDGRASRPAPLAGRDARPVPLPAPSPRAPSARSGG
ncbi:MAG: DUF2927 domain-containing protein [Paracoccaceae bacterium]